MVGNPASESLLDELSLADADFGEFNIAEENRMGEGRLERSYLPIAIEAIVEDSPFQTRLVAFAPEEIPEDADLLESVRRHGVLEPVYVERLTTKLGEPSSYRLVSGHRRLAAARAAGLEHVPGIVAKQDDDLQALNLAENSGHRQLLPYEKAIALVERRQKDQGLSLRKLAKLTGIPFGTTSDLVAAYEKSPPALRKLFAEGVAARTIIELQAVFDRFEEDAQVATAKLLNGVSIGQAQTFRQLVEQGVAPEAAARSAIGFDKTEARGTAELASSEQPVRGDSSNSRKSTQNPTANKPTMGLHPDDEAGLEALCAQTGVHKRTGRALAREAHQARASYEALTFAAAYVARGGERKRALPRAMESAKKRGVAGTVRKHLRQLERARSLIERQEDTEIADFLSTIFFGA